MRASPACSFSARTPGPLASSWSHNPCSPAPRLALRRSHRCAPPGPLQAVFFRPCSTRASVASEPRCSGSLRSCARGGQPSSEQSSCGPGRWSTSRRMVTYGRSGCRAGGRSWWNRAGHGLPAPVRPAGDRSGPPAISGRDDVHLPDQRDGQHSQFRHAGPCRWSTGPARAGWKAWCWRIWKTAHRRPSGTMRCS